MTQARTVRFAGLDFGTTNTVAALADGRELPRLVKLDGPNGGHEVFRSALRFWEDEGERNGIAVEAGPAAIREYLAFPSDSRFLQSFKSVAASPNFESASIFSKRLRFEELGRIFLEKLVSHSAGNLDRLERVVVGRRVHHAWCSCRPGAGQAALPCHVRRLRGRDPLCLRAAGGGLQLCDPPETPGDASRRRLWGCTSDFSVVRVEEPGAAQRCVPLGHAGVGIAGDRFDQRIVERLVLPRLGKGGQYRSFDKVLEIPGCHFCGLLRLVETGAAADIDQNPQSQDLSAHGRR